MEITTDWLLNCTGPERDLTKSADPLTRALLARGLLVPDAHRLGARTTAAGELLDAAGRTVPGVFVVGPWRAAASWESTAVPELRVQADDVAERISAITRASGRARASGREKTFTQSSEGAEALLPGQTSLARPLD